VVTRYRDRVDFDALVREFEIETEHLHARARQIQRLDDRIAAEHQRAYPDDVPSSIRGVGPVAVSAIRATISDTRAHKNAGTLRAHSGLTPREDSSGDAQRRGPISQAGPDMLRWALYLAGDIARQYNPQLAALYRRLMVERGRPATRQPAPSLPTTATAHTPCYARTGRANPATSTGNP
jgi:transposase